MKCLILFWSSGGNTQKVAQAIEKTINEQHIEVDTLRITEHLEINFDPYDLIFFGSPSYQWIPPEEVQHFIKRTLKRERHGVRPLGAPKRHRTFSIAFCTYSGVHTGEREGWTAGAYMAQFLEHMGCFVLDQWYTPGKFQGWEEGSLYGKMGDISQRPNEEDIRIIKMKTNEVLAGLVD